MTTTAALSALCTTFEVEGMAERALGIARDPTRPSLVRVGALIQLSVAPNLPEEKRELALSLVRDATEDKSVRSQASVLLGRVENAGQEIREVLRSILLAGEDTDEEWQRGVLHALGRVLPLEDLETLLQDPRVARHRYYAIRADVASGLAVLGSRERATFDILTNYLTEEDPKDENHLVRQEAWLGLWQLTGVPIGVKAIEFERRRPESAAVERACLWTHGRDRLHVTPRMVQILEPMLSDTAEMEEVRRAYERLLGVD